MEHAEFDAWFESLPAGDHPRDGKEWALEGWKAAKDTVFASEGQANLWARADYPVKWTRHGSGINEWWSRDGYEARKTVSGRWVLSRDGLPIFEHEYLQEVMDRAFVLTQDAAAEIAALRERIAGMEKDAKDAERKGIDRALDVLAANFYWSAYERVRDLMEKQG